MIIDLRTKKCVPCEGGVLPIAGAHIQEYLQALTLPWEVLEEKKIRHEFVFKNFKEAMIFVNRVAELAEAEGHHPDAHISYNKVVLELWTHAISGLSENDFILASKIEAFLTV